MGIDTDQAGAGKKSDTLITVISTGSRGDVQPYIALAVGLKKAGYRVRVALPENFAGLVAAQNVGLEFHPLRGDFQALLQGEGGRMLMNSGLNLVKSLRAINAMMQPVIEQLKQDSWSACQGADLLVTHMPVSLFTHAAAEKLGIPFINADLAPLMPTRASPSPMFPIRRNIGGVLNRATGQFLRNIMWRMFQGSINHFRQEQGLRWFGAYDYFKALDDHLMLEAYSPLVFPRPADWGAMVDITGYWFLDEPDWTPPLGLVDFLDAGETPVYIGFGSMTDDDPEATTTVVLDAVRQSGKRAVLASGWGGIKALDVPESVYVLQSAPHNWLFPRMAAVVHHGGAGTTAAGLRAGVPAVTVWYIADQPFWGNRLYRLGVGTKPISRKKLTAEKLAAAIIEATQPGIRQCAADLGVKIRAEDGIGNAIHHVEQVLNSGK